MESSSLLKVLYNQKAFFTHAAWLRSGFAPILQYSPLLPPVGVRAVSQSRCHIILSDQLQIVAMVGLYPTI